MSLLKLDPRYDVAFPCPRCSFVARGPGALEDHLNEHGALPVTASVEVIEEPATESVVPVKTPKTFQCSACGEKFVGYGEFMRHKREEKRR